MDKQVAKLRRRLDSALGQRQFYEAHQIMRTIHWRIIQQYEQTAAAEPQKNPSAEAQVEDLLKMLRVGCITMCDAREFTSAIDLAELYVDALKRTQQQLSSDNFANLLQLFSLLPAELDSDNSAPLVDSDDAMSDGNECKKTTDRRTPFMNKSLDWALKSAEGRPERLQGCVELQRRFAEVLAGEGRIEQADRLVRAADWLLSQIDRGTQSSAGPSASAEEGGMESTPVEQPQESRIVSDIDLD